MKDVVEIKETAANSGRILCLQTTLGLPQTIGGGKGPASEVRHCLLGLLGLCPVITNDATTGI